MTQGDKIRVKRTAKGYSQEFVANKLKIIQPAYASIESNKTNLSVKRLKEIATILQIKVEDIVNFDDKIHIETVTNSQVGSGSYYEKEGNLKLVTEKLEQQIAYLEKDIVYLKNELKKKDDFINSLLKKIK